MLRALENLIFVVSVIFVYGVLVMCLPLILLVGCIFAAFARPVVPSLLINKAAALANETYARVLGSPAGASSNDDALSKLLRGEQTKPTPLDPESF